MKKVTFKDLKELYKIYKKERELWNISIEQKFKMTFDEIQKRRKISDDLNNKSQNILNKYANSEIFYANKKVTAAVKFNNIEILNYIKDWNIISKSPYSNSYYNSDDIDWDYKPEGSLRLSDHWNFESNGEIHCKLDNTKEYTKKILLCEYHNGYYHIIKEF